MHFTSDDVFASQFHSMQMIFRKKLGSAKAFCVFKNLKRLSSEHVLMCLEPVVNVTRQFNSSVNHLKTCICLVGICWSLEHLLCRYKTECCGSRYPL